MQLSVSKKVICLFLLHLLLLLLGDTSNVSNINAGVSV